MVLLMGMKGGLERTGEEGSEDEKEEKEEEEGLVLLLVVLLLLLRFSILSATGTMSHNVTPLVNCIFKTRCLVLLLLFIAAA